MAGGRIDIEVAPDLKQFPAQLESGMRGAVGVATKVGGLLGVAVGATAAAQAVLDIGNSFTNELNTMQAVSQATAEQMKAVSEAAQGLGNDSSIADASAADAAAAMTELAKGGFSVDEAMAAARGTLQLAAAAQIGAADAATIQSKALQAFGLDASYAATAADVLANGANASSAEITEIAFGLQQAGSVANSFGVSLEDTVAGLGLLANAGIAGSDAGTLLKTTLLALTDQSNPAQGAIEDLGLTVYDATGKFVGFRSLFEQLQTASENMTPEMYQAATATLFGSDAMRLASVAAEQGVEGWDAMRDAIEREGAAADVAAARTQGLPGAMSAAQNAAEGLAIRVYDLVDGPLESLMTKGAEFVTQATPAIVDGLSSVMDIAGDVGSALVPVVGVLGDVGSAFMDLPASVQIAVGALAAVNGLGIDDKVSGWVDSASEPFKNFAEQMDAVRLAMAEAQLESEGYDLSGETQSVEQLGVLLSENEEQISDVAAAWATMEARSPAIAKMGDAYRGVTARTGEFAQRQREASAESGRFVGAMRNAGAAAAVFGGRVTGVAAAGLSGMKSAVGGVVGALGGPLMLGLAAASMAITELVSAARRIKDAERAWAEYGTAVSDTNAKLRDALDASNGVVDESVTGVMTERVDLLRNTSQRLADDAPGLWGKFGAAAAAGWDLLDGSMDGAALKSQYTAQQLSDDGARIVAAMDATGLSSQELGEIVAGSGSEFAAFTTRLTSAGGESAYLAAELIEMRGEFLESQSAAGQVGAAIEKIEDKAVGAADGVDQLTNAVGRLRDENRTAEEAQKAVTMALDGFTSAVSNGGAAVVDASGKIDLSTTAGVRLDDAMKRVASAWDEAGAAARTSAEQQGKSQEEVQAAVEAAQAEVRRQFVDTAADALGSKEAAEALASIFLAWPPTAETEIVVHDQAAREAIDRFIRENQGRTIGVYVDAITGSGAPNNPAVSRPPVDANGNVRDRSLEDLLLPGNAIGGKLPTTGPGTEVTDGIFAIGPNGLPMARVNGGEWVVNDVMSDRYDRELAMINAGTFPKLPGFETGGRIAVNRAVDFLRPESGKDYQYGGVGNPSWDCSGYVSAGYAMLTGRDPYTRWFTTESDFNALGFKSGTGPASALNIGVMRGGGGMYSHMAGTIAGMPFESSSSGVVFGTGTQGAADPNLPLKWYLPVSAFVPPGDDTYTGGRYDRRAPRDRETWDEQDELKLDSARIAVQQAIEDRDKALNDPKKSQADKDQAENKLQQAEAKVRELEGKKRAAEAGVSVSPDAPELTSNLTDDELRLRSLERAVDEARWDRNDVYADPDATQYERDEADDKLQQAINSLREEQEEQRDEIAPPAPALQGRMTDDQIRLVELEQAVKEAEKDRNAVYADPRSTDDDRLAADLDLQKALNARDEGRKGKSGSGSGSGVKSVGAVGLELAETFAGGILETFGLEDSPIGFLPKLLFGSGDIGGPLLKGIGTTGIPAMIAQQQQVGPTVAPSFSQEELAMQGPVAPGSPGWIEELIDTLRVPAVLRDAGGPLPHGMAGLNLSGETEWVQTAEDKRRYDRDMRELAALRAASTSGLNSNLAAEIRDLAHITRSVAAQPRSNDTINNYGMDPDKVTRNLERHQRRRSLAMQRSGGFGR
ncbi:phage tail tape measure protein [Rhodococcus aetherivorans]|uniref:phage tail tape measure protein n=1 Tax=Rhodococcus aetherivorans TaxID=191292 RepID=UPI0021AD635A|nr:phage tail tape measure protein [Rhodococcus aetherivorans]